jgi:hypothetical protein
VLFAAELEITERFPDGVVDDVRAVGREERFHGLLEVAFREGLGDDCGRPGVPLNPEVAGLIKTKQRVVAAVTWGALWADISARRPNSSSLISAPKIRSTAASKSKSMRPPMAT